jgi:hypothetical protein
MLLAGCGNPGGGSPPPIDPINPIATLDPCFLDPMSLECECKAQAKPDIVSVVPPPAQADYDYPTIGPKQQVLYTSGSGYYGYRPGCNRFVVDLGFAPVTYGAAEPDRPDPIYWNAGAWDLPSSSVNEPEFGGPLSSVGDPHDSSRVNSGSTSVPNNPVDCALYNEDVTLYMREFHFSGPPPGFLMPGPWNQVYTERSHGTWVNGACTQTCDSSSTKCKGASAYPLRYPNADIQQPTREYRFSIGTSLRTSWQETSVVLWEVDPQAG